MSTTHPNSKYSASHILTLVSTPTPSRVSTTTAGHSYFQATIPTYGTGISALLHGHQCTLLGLPSSAHGHELCPSAWNRRGLVIDVHTLGAWFAHLQVVVKNLSVTPGPSTPFPIHSDLISSYSSSPFAIYLQYLINC